MTPPRTLAELVPLILDDLAQGDAAYRAYLLRIGNLLREAQEQQPPGRFMPWLGRQIKAGRFGHRASPVGELKGLSLEDELIEALIVAKTEA